MVGELVGDQGLGGPAGAVAGEVGAEALGGAFEPQDVLVVAGHPGVLHGADGVVGHRDLVVLDPRVAVVEEPGKMLHHAGGVAEGPGPLRQPSLRVGPFLAPVVGRGLPALDGPQQPAVRDHGVGLRHGHHHLGRVLVVDVGVERQPVGVEAALAVGVDEGALGVLAVGLEIHAGPGRPDFRR